METGCRCGGDGPDPREEKLRAVIEAHRGTPGALIPVLHEAQELYGHLPLDVQKAVSEGLDVPLSEIYGVVTFYAQFSLVPKGRHRVSVCMGTACYVKGAGRILERLQEELGIGVGGCTPDGEFSLEACRCIGACGLAPVMTVNDEVFGKLASPEEASAVLAKIRAKEAAK
jgi:NADP-reducing hydrogenase subunit HndA